jgi:hypothetical protein
MWHWRRRMNQGALLRASSLSRLAGFLSVPGGPRWLRASPAGDPSLITQLRITLGGGL